MKSKLSILITGANGFIGSHLMRTLTQNDSYLIRGLVRKTSNLFRLQGGNYNLVWGSINDPLEKYMKGIDCVIHTAGKASDWGKYDDFYRVNVEGTLNVLKEAIKAGVKRFIHFSSTVVYGFRGNTQTSEEADYRPFHNNYCITKVIAERRVLSFTDRIAIFVLRPANVYGPFDTSFTLPLLHSLEKGLIGFVKGGTTITAPCYVKNIVGATENALNVTQGIGETFNISDGNDIRWQEFLSLVSQKLGVTPPRLYVPTFPLTIIATILEKLYLLAGSKKPPLITPYRIAQVARNYSFSIEKARRLLGYFPRYTTEQGIDESIKWYREFSHQSE